MALEELFADNCPFGPETREVPLASLVTIEFNQLLEGNQVLSGGFEEDDDLIEVDRQGEGLKREDASLIGHPMF